MRTAGVNVAGMERWASSMAGAGLAAVGIKQLRDERPLAAAAAAAAGLALIYRGATGHCPVYQTAGISTADQSFDTRVRLAGPGGVMVDEATMINRSPEELYTFWRDFEQLPCFMRNLVRVRVVDRSRSQWEARGPAGRLVKWDAEIINDIPHELIAWRTTRRADVVSAGSVRFKRHGGRHGTEVHVKLQYDPAAGKLGAALAWLYGVEPSQAIREDLRRFKQLMEAGEIPTTRGQSVGAGKGASRGGR